MKKILTGITLATTLMVVGCSTNTRNENTGIGAVTGAAVGGVGVGLAGGNPVAIGLGVVGGALIGGVIGHNMDSTDTATSNEAMQANQSRSWVNSRTGTSYTMTPTSGLFTVKGNPNCRTFHMTATTTSGRTHQYNGTACLMNDGRWHTVSR